MVNYSSAGDTIIEHQEQLGDALMEYFAGDSILVYPGRYRLTEPYNLADPVTISGAGQRGDVIGGLKNICI